MQNGLFKISLGELGTSAVNAVFTAIIFAIGSVVMTSGFNVFSADWGAIAQTATNAGFIAFIAFVTSHLTSTNQGAAFGAIPFNK